MAKVRVHDVRDSKWMGARDFGSESSSGMDMTDDELSQFTEEALKSQVRLHEPGDEDTLQLFESILPPNIFVDIHSHASDEIIYVVKGSLEFGTRSLGPGSSVFVGANSLYSFRSGTEGLQFLNFRPHKDTVYRNREQHRAYLKETEKAAGGEQGAAQISE